MTAIQTDVREEVFGRKPGTSLLRQLRAGGLKPVLRLSGIALWTGGMFLFLVGGMWVSQPWPRARLSWRNRVVRRWARGMARIVKMRTRVVGRPPKAPFFLVANHQSYVDIVLLLANLDTVFVAKRELAAWPAVGYLTRLVGTIFLDRRRSRDAHRVLERIGSRIGLGDGVVVFPEGTSSAGDGVYPMKAALFEWAATTEYPVHVVTIHYATLPGQPSAREAVCWWGDMSFVPHVIELCRMPGFEATVHFGADPLRGNDRGDLAVRARQAIVDNFVPHISGGPELE